MAWNPSPKVAAAQEIGQRFGKDQVIVFMIDRKKDIVEYASWGKTKSLCDNARKIADAAFVRIIEKAEV